MTPTDSAPADRDLPVPGSQAEYEALWAEYQAVMHRGAWRIGWGLFAVMVGLLPLMWFFIWLVGPSNWEQTLFHEPVLMWLAVPLSLILVVALVFHLYRKNLELDATKRTYLVRLKGYRDTHPAPRPGPGPAQVLPSKDPDAFRDDNSFT